MPISATGNRRLAGDAGVSLVEAMVALMIVGLMAGAVVLLAPGPEREVRSEAERLAARISLASEESVIVNRPVALLVTAEGYGFERLGESGWVAETHVSALGFRAWSADVDVAVVETEAGDGEARVVRFDATGGATPAVIELSRAGIRWRVAIDGQGGAHVAAAE